MKIETEIDEGTILDAVIRFINEAEVTSPFPFDLKLAQMGQWLMDPVGQRCKWVRGPDNEGYVCVQYEPYLLELINKNELSMLPLNSSAAAVVANE